MSRTDEGKYKPVERGNGVQFIGVYCPQYGRRLRWTDRDLVALAAD